MIFGILFGLILIFAVEQKEKPPEKPMQLNVIVIEKEKQNE